MSKFYLPTQKGAQLFPTTVVAPPIVRWVGVDPRTADGQAILDMYGSAITAFHMQQAHNHSLSVNTQSRGFVQLAPNLGVQYVNQGGAEYITIYAQIQPPAEEKKPEVQKPVIAGPCWNPPEVVGIGSLHDMLIRSGVVLADPVPVTLWVAEYYLDLGYYFTYIQDTVPLGFSRPLNLYGNLFSEFGGVGWYPQIFLNGRVFNAGGVPRNTPFPKTITVNGGAGAYSPAIVTTRSGSTVFPGSDDPRRYMMIEWIPTSTGEGAVNSAMLFIEGHDRSSRGYCPTLFAFGNSIYAGDGPVVAETDAVYYDVRQSPPFIRSYGQFINGLTEVRNKFAWSYVDPITHEFVSLSAENPWAPP